MLEWLTDLFSSGKNLKQLAKWLRVEISDFDKVNLSYRTFSIPKKKGGKRTICSPNAELKQFQRLLLRRLLNGLAVHPQATGFRKGISFVDNARCHQAQKIVVKIDLVDFFPSIHANWVQDYFKAIGWNRRVAQRLTQLTTHEGKLPQGAPTSPVLSNLVSYAMDTRLANLIRKNGGIYTRYADDVAISFSEPIESLNSIVGRCFKIIRDEGYVPHVGKKFSVRRNYRRQLVSGLVVNQTAQLPREKRRWLRSVGHRFEQAKGGSALSSRPTLSRSQYDGWLSLQKLINGKRG